MAERNSQVGEGNATPGHGSELVRSVSFQAAWDKRHTDPAKNFGVHGVQIDFVLRGPEGAVYFPLLTTWMLPEVEEWHQQLARENPGLGLPAPFSIHSRTPREDWEHKEHCEFLDAACWSTSSGYTVPGVIWERMLREGGPGFWQALEDIYQQNLGVEKPSSDRPEGSTIKTEGTD